MSTDAQKPKFTAEVVSQYIKDFSFENPGILDYLSKPDKPDISVDIQVHAQQANETVFEVELFVQASAKLRDKTLFMVELKYAGLFSFPEPGNPESLKPYLLIECPRLLFPFARSIIAQSTSDGGYLPLMLNPVDFHELYRIQEVGNKEERTLN